MEQSGFIVGIDLGTSKIVGLLARKNEQGIISVLASETIAVDSSIRHGVVYNVEEVAGKIKRVLNLLENKTGKKIAKAYFSVAGMSLESFEHTETNPLPEETDITVGMVDKLEVKAKSFQPDNFLTNYGVVVPMYYLDGKYVEDVTGHRAALVEGKFQLILGRPNIKNNIRAVANKAGIGIAGMLLGPITTSAIALSAEDKMQGCAFVDMGAGTTNVSIYKDGLLKFFSVIPMGGRTVTKDIRALGFIEAAAEDYKIRYGKVGKEKNKHVAEDRADSGIDVKELNKVIQLRVEEIVMNVHNQIEESGYAEKIPAGIIISGGASLQTGLEGFMSEKTKLPVKKAVPNKGMINNVSDLVQNPVYSHALSLLMFANGNCEKQEEPIKAPVVEHPMETQENVPIQQPVQHPTPQPVLQPQPQSQSSVAPDSEPKEEIHVKPEKTKKRPFGHLFDGLKSLFEDEKDEDENAEKE